MARRGSGRTWKLIGLAGLAGVTATGVVLARNERRRRAYTPDEVRARLHQRHVEALAAPAVEGRAAAAGAAGPGAGPDAGRPGVGRPDAGPAMLADPERVARAEAEAWIGYYRREWARALHGGLVMVREGFGTTPLQTVRGGWLLLRAVRAWAPADNDPDAARALMERFYRIVAAARGWSIDPQQAARLEVAWWAVHRELQRDTPDEDDAGLVAALADLYAYVHTRPAHLMVPAARYRADAMRLSDAWVRDGCRLDDPRLRAEEARLVLSYTCLRDALAD